jgi:phage head maturation protease
VEFAPADDPVSGADAEQALRWVDRGVLGVSVGFNPLEYVYNEERESDDPWQNLFYPPLDYVRSELLEVSIVVIPANADALAEGRERRELVQRAAPHLLERLRVRGVTVPPPAPVGELTKDDVAQLVRAAIKTQRGAIQARRTGSLG